MELKRTLKYLRKDVWAQISAFYIFLVIVVATFAYQLIPDKTKNANQMHLSIHSKGPGFSCLLLIIPRDTSTARKSFFNGKISSNDEIPVKDSEMVLYQPKKKYQTWAGCVFNDPVIIHNKGWAIVTPNDLMEMAKKQEATTH